VTRVGPVMCAAILAATAGLVVVLRPRRASTVDF
jgi:hypothetical protein